MYSVFSPIIVSFSEHCAVCVQMWLESSSVSDSSQKHIWDFFPSRNKIWFTNIKRYLIDISKKNLILEDYNRRLICQALSLSFFSTYKVRYLTFYIDGFSANLENIHFILYLYVLTRQNSEQLLGSKLCA